jgi:hypothetical protein
MITDQERQELRTDFNLYALNCLKIRTKSGAIADFELNSAQQYLDKKINEQIKKNGKVRAIILKGRQQGISTYIEGRLFWRVSNNAGKRAFILTHEAEATNNLFEMADRYYQLCPELFKPRLGASSQRELSFDLIDSGYRVGTAGNKNTGRSSTIQYFHGSEAAFWDNASDIAKGALQAVADEEGTEIFIESTANGKLNWFYEQWQLAIAGESDYQPIFIPWFWQQEYRVKPSSSMIATAEELDMMKLYNLDMSQLAWRRKKIAELSSAGLRGEDEFRQEYPSTWEEAFESSTLGLAFEKLRRERHLVKNFKIPEFWTKFTVIDWGTAKPFAVCWFAVVDSDTVINGNSEYQDKFLPANSLILYREFYGWNGQPNIGCRLESPQVAKRVLEVEEETGEIIDFRIGDSAMWGQHDGMCVAERMLKETSGRYRMIQSRKGKEQNYQEFRARLQGDDHPAFFAMAGCKHFWRTVPSLQLDELHPEKGPDSDQEDHIYDCVAYACASRPFITTQKDRIKVEIQESIRQSKKANKMLAFKKY